MTEPSEVRQVNNLADAKCLLDTAEPIARHFLCNPIQAIRQHETAWIFNALERAYTAYIFIHPAYGSSDEVYAQAQSELERAKTYVLELARAVQEHPDSNVICRGRAFAMQEAVKALSKQLDAA